MLKDVFTLDFNGSKELRALYNAFYKEWYQIDPKVVFEEYRGELTNRVIITI